MCENMNDGIDQIVPTNEVDEDIDASDIELKDPKDSQLSSFSQKKGSVNPYKIFSLGNISISLGSSKSKFETGKILADRLVVLGEPTSGKTTFMNTILGNVNINSGTVRYGGRIGYVSQKIWFRSLSVRENVVMGRTLD